MLKKWRKALTLALAIAVAASGLYTVLPANNANAYDIDDLTTMPMNLIVGSFKGYDAGKDVEVNGDFAYLADSTAGLQIVDIANKAKPVAVGNIAAETSVTKVTLKDDIAYIVDGNNLKSVNVANGAEAEVLDSIAVSQALRIQAIGNYVYVIDGNPALRIIDASQPDELVEAAVINLPSFGSISSGYVLDDKAYLFNGSVLFIVNVANPQSPVIAGQITLPAGNYTDIFATADHAYLSEVSGLVAVNTSEASNPVIEFSYPLDNKPASVFVAGNKAFVGSAGGSHNFVILDLINPASPQKWKSSYSFVTSGTNWFGVNTNNAVKVEDNYAYLANNYLGLMILDINKGLMEPPTITFRDHTVAPPSADLTPISVDLPDVDGYKGTIASPGTDWMQEPALLRISDSIRPGELLTVYGEGMTSTDGKLAFLPVADTNTPAEPPAGAVYADPVDVDSEGQTISAVLPDELTPGSYYVWVQNDYGWSAPIVLNGTRPQWVSQPEVAPGLQVSVVGQGLDGREFGAGLATKVVLSDGVNAYEVPIAEVNPFRIKFIVPTIPAGDYTVLVSNDGIVWRESEDGRKLSVIGSVADPLGLGVSWANQFVWDHVINVKDAPYSAQGDGVTDDSAAIQAAMDAAGAAGGGVVYIPSGTYNLQNVLRFPAKVVLQGESRAGTILNYAYTGSDRPNAVVFGMKEEAKAIGKVGMTNFTFKIDPAASFDQPMWLGHDWGATVDDFSQRTAQYIFILNMNLETSFNRLPTGRSFANVIISKGNIVIRGNNFSGYANTISSSYTGEYADFSHNDFYTVNMNAGMQTYVMFEDNYVSRNPYAATNEDTAQGIWARGYSYFTNNYIENTGQPTSNDGEILAVESYRGGTKMYGEVTGATDTTLSINPLKKADNSLMGATGLNNWNLSKRSYGEWYVLIVRGTGLGQLRKVTDANQASSTLGVDKPWDILPDETSKFAVYLPNKGVIIHNNTVVNGAKGLWLYGQNYDSVIAGNTGTNVEGAYINAVQGNDRLDTNYFHRLENNHFTGGGNKNGLSGVGVRAELNAGGTFGYIAYGIAQKGNSVQHVTDPAVKKDATEAPNINGIYAVYESRVQQAEIKTVMKAVTIENNTVNNVDRGITVGPGHVSNAFSQYPFSSGILIKDNVIKNTRANFIDAGTTDTTLVTPISKEVNLAFMRPAASSSTLGAYRAGNAVDGDSDTSWQSDGDGVEWLYVDLGRTNAIHAVSLHWGDSYATQYKVQVSDDADAWSDVESITDGNGGTDDISLAAETIGRYVRIVMNQSSDNGYGLREVEVMGIPSPLLMKTETNLAGDKLLLTFDQYITNLQPAPAGFAVSASQDGDTTPIQISAVALNSDQRIVELTLTEELAYGSVIDISYTPGTLQTIDGGKLMAFVQWPVINRIPAPPVAPPPGTNLVSNSGFENGLASWSAYSSGTLTLDTSIKYEGEASGKLADRTVTYAGPGQNLTNALYNSGPGTYSSSAWVRLASGEDTAKMTLKVESSGDGVKYVNLATGTIGQTFAQIAGTADVTWTGSLLAATLYVETQTSKAAIHLDDVRIVKSADDASLQPVSASFDKNEVNQANVNTTITWRGATRVTEVRHHASVVDESHYSISGNMLTIKKEYLASLAAGSVVLTIVFDYGAPATLTITVSDTSGPAVDPFLPYLSGNVPEIVTELGTVTENGITVRKLVFHSREISGVDENVYAIIARPAAEGSYPGVLYLHGGGGFAEEQAAISWAQKGYIAMVLDEPGIADPTKSPHSTGPWKDMSYGADRFIARPDITSSTIFGAVAAGLNAFNLLADQPGIQQDRIGITGISWGGYLTTMMAGMLEDRVQAAYSVFGTGYYDKGTTFLAEGLNQMDAADREQWLQHLDAGRRASGIKASYYVAGAVRDHFFWPPAIKATLNDIPGYKNLAFAPDASHQLYGLPGGDTSTLFFDYYLKEIGDPFPLVTIEGVSTKPDGGKSIIVKVDSTTAIQTVNLYYSSPNPSWEARAWNATVATALGNNRFEATLTAAQVAENGDWYINASDTRPVTAGTFVYNVSDNSYNPVQLQEIGSVDTPIRASGVTVVGEYAYVADNNGVQIVHVADPAEPMLDGYIQTSVGGTPTIASRGNHIFFADKTAGINKLYAYDVSNPTAPVLKGQIGVTSANRLQIAGNLLYVFDGGPGVRIIDISNPSNMVQRALIAPGGSVGTGYVSDNLLYLMAGANFRIYDVFNPSSPALVGTADLSGNANGYYLSTAKAGDYVYVGDGNVDNSKLLIIDVSDPEHPEQVGAHATVRGPQDIMVRDDYALIGYYANRFEVLDISDRTAPKLGNMLSLTDNVFDLEVHGDYVYLANSVSGLKIIQVTLPEAEPEAASIILSSSEATVGIGQTVTISAEVYDADDEIINGVAISWTSNDPGIASVADGVIAGIAGGSTIVRAEYGGLSAEIAVTVIIPPGINLLNNPGFEDGAAGWEQYGAVHTVVTESANVHGGSRALKASGRNQNYHGPRQSVLDQLRNSGPGKYYLSAWVKVASATASAPLKVMIEYKHRTGGGPETTTNINVPNRPLATNSEFVQVSGFIDIAWPGELTFAKIELNSLESASPYVDFFVDDVVFMKVDITGLSNAIEAASQLVEEDYTPESWVSFAEALHEAEQLLLQGATQTELDAALTNLSMAIAQLQEAQSSIATSLVVLPDNVALSAGQSVTVTATVYDQNETALNDVTIVWSSEDTDVATVNNGVISGVGPGITVVRAEYEDLSAEIEVTVLPVHAMTAVLQGLDEAVEGESYVLTYGLIGALQVSAQEVTITYDSQAFELTGVEVMAEHTVIVETIDDEPGTVTYKLATTGSENALNGDLEVLRLSFAAQALSAGSFFAVESLRLADGAGNETEGTTAQKNVAVKAAIDHTALQDVIQAAQALHDSAIEGYTNGSYLLGSKAALQTAIAAALNVLDFNEASQPQLDQAKAQLEQATAVFQTRLITSGSGDLTGAGGQADGKISIADLGFVAYHFGKTADDANWAHIQAADIDGNGSIDIFDLTFVARRMN